MNKIELSLEISQKSVMKIIKMKQYSMVINRYWVISIQKIQSDQDQKMLRIVKEKF